MWEPEVTPPQEGQLGSSKPGGHRDAGIPVLDPTPRWVEDKDPGRWLPDPRCH